MSKQHPLVLYVGDNHEEIEPHVFYMYTISEAVEVLAILGMNMPDAVIINQRHPLAANVLGLVNSANWFSSQIILIAQNTTLPLESVTCVQSEHEAIELLMGRLRMKKLQS